MNYEELLEKYEKLQLTHGKTYKKYKGFQSGYKKSQRKLGEIQKINSNLQKQIEQVKGSAKVEIQKYKMIAQKYKKTGLDFVTKKRVLDLQQTVNTQEEKLFRFREKIVDQKKVINNFNTQTKKMRQENIDIKNVLNNINLQIAHFLPSSSASSVSDIELTKTILKSTEPIKPVLKEEQVTVLESDSETISETIKEEVKEIVSEDESDEENEYDTDESEVDTGFLSD